MGKIDKIIIATGNEGKMKEFRRMLEGTGVLVQSMKEAGITADIEEDGTTFAENAKIKAQSIAEKAGCLVLADDSGLVVDAMDGEPGIYSARWMGEDTSYDIKNQAIIDRLEGVPEEKRTARFVCAIVGVFPDGRVLEAEGVMEGLIGHRIAGANGFGYDPIFFLPQFGMSSAEISPEQKDEVSHRGKALRSMEKLLQKELEKA